MPSLREYYQSLLSNPNVQRALAVIARAEGSDYYTLVGQGTNNKGMLRYGTSKHPKELGFKGVYNPRVNDYSTAAGRYQIVGKTWRGLQRQGIVGDSFAPREQDIAAVALLAQRGALKDVVQGNVQGFWAKTRQEWESFKLKSYNTIAGYWNSAGGSYSPSAPSAPYGDFQQVATSPNGKFSSVFGTPFNGELIRMDAETKRGIILAIAALVILYAVVTIWL